MKILFVDLLEFGSVKNVGLAEYFSIVIKQELEHRHTKNKIVLRRNRLVINSMLQLRFGKNKKFQGKDEN